MFDDVQLGWLSGDDYGAAAEAAGVVELPDELQPDEPAEAPPPGPCPTADRVLDDLLTQQWTDRDPGSVGK